MNHAIRKLRPPQIYCIGPLKNFQIRSLNRKILKGSTRLKQPHAWQPFAMAQLRRKLQTLAMEKISRDNKRSIWISQNLLSNWNRSQSRQRNIGSANGTGRKTANMQKRNDFDASALPARYTPYGEASDLRAKIVQEVRNLAHLLQSSRNTRKKKIH